MNPYQVTRDFEAALCEYTGAPFACALNSCTAALMLAVKRCAAPGLEIAVPARTYVSVPMSITHAGARPHFTHHYWRGAYQLRPLPVWDCARRFTGGMYRAGQFQCVSFAASKILAAEQGGAILHDDAEADKWFRRMRFDGRTELLDPKDDDIHELGHHCIMTPSVAAGLLVRLHHLPRHNEDLPDYPYPDLSQMAVFK
jgi:dTDP-4-amino-4,6-dideoxygalactose transaminase